MNRVHNDMKSCARQLKLFPAQDLQRRASGMTILDLPFELR